MNRKILLTLAVVMLLSLLPAASHNIQTAEAYAWETSHTKTCSTFAATGTTDAPYVTVSIYDPSTDASLFLAIFPATNGNFSIDVTYPQQPEGKTIIYHIWGNPSATDPWSTTGGAFITIEEPCSFVPPPLYASPISFSARCNSFSGNGRSSAPYVGIQVKTSGGATLYVGKVPNNIWAYPTFTFNVSFAKQPNNALLRYIIWPSTTAAVTEYDGTPYPYAFNQTMNCKK